MRIPSYSLLVRIAKTKFIRNVIPAGRDWDSISFAVAYVMDIRSAVSIIKNKTYKTINWKQREKGARTTGCRPACSNTSTRINHHNSMRCHQMTDTNSILPEPENKSFDKNIQLGIEVLKICFNPCCNNKSENWITIIGRFAGYRDYEVPYCVCDNCNSFLGFRLQALNHLVNTLQDMGKVQRTGVDIEAHNPPSDKMTVTTKDLNNLTFETSAYDMMESEEEIKQYDEPKVCYNPHCNDEGTSLDRYHQCNYTTS